MKRSRVRNGLTVATCALAAAGVLLGMAAPTSAGEPAPAPARPADCPTVGAYVAPAPDSAGLPTGLVLCASGPITVTVPGTLLDGWDVRGGIVVDAPDVTVRRTRVTGDGSAAYGVRTTAKGSVRIEDTTLTGDFPTAAVGGDRWSAERIRIAEVSRDGARLGAGARLRNSVVRDVGGSSGTPASGVILGGGGDPVLLEDNTIDLGGAADPNGSSAAGSAVLLAAGPARPASGSVVVRGNVLGGGRWVLRQDDDGMSPPDVLITGNRFRRDPGGKPLRVSREAVLTDNSYVDGGLLPEQ